MQLFGNTKHIAASHNSARQTSMACLGCTLCRGKGVGAALIQALLSSAGSQDVYLVTIGRRVSLYERAGFKEVPREEVPRWGQGNEGGL